MPGALRRRLRAGDHRPRGNHQGHRDGDCRRGQSLVVNAINEGREAAREIDRFLMGSTELP